MNENNKINEERSSVTFTKYICMYMELVMQMYFYQTIIG